MSKIPKMNLREWLFRTRITVSEFSTLIGITRSYLYSILRGDNNPSPLLLDRVKDITLGKISAVEQLRYMAKKYNRQKCQKIQENLKKKQENIPI